MTAVALPAGGLEGGRAEGQQLQDDKVRPCNRERRGYINLAAVWTLEGALESLSYFWPLSTHNPTLIKQKGVVADLPLLIIWNGSAIPAKSGMIQTLGSLLSLCSRGVQHRHSSA